MNPAKKAEETGMIFDADRTFLVEIDGKQGRWFGLEEYKKFWSSSIANAYLAEEGLTGKTIGPDGAVHEMEDRERLQLFAYCSQNFENP